MHALCVSRQVGESATQDSHFMRLSLHIIRSRNVLVNLTRFDSRTFWSFRDPSAKSSIKRLEPCSQSPTKNPLLTISKKAFYATMSLINRFFNAPSAARNTLFHHPAAAHAVFNDPFFNDPFFSDGHLARFPSAGLLRHQTLNAPLMDLQENEKSYLVNLNVPGFKKDDIEVVAEGNTVSIKGTWKSETDHSSGSGAANDHKDDQDTYIYKERSASSFHRSFTLENFDADNISAKLQDGVLQLTLPKISQTQTQKKISIA